MSAASIYHEPVQVRLFPNSGHQYVHLPLARLLPQQDEAFCNSLVENNRGPWCPWMGNPWILFRYDFDERNVPSVFLAIETNLGRNDRGILFDIEEELLDEKPDEDEIYEAYYCEEEAALNTRIVSLDRLPRPERIKDPQSGRWVSGAQVRFPQNLEIKLEIYFIARAGYDPVDVDLIIDLGNTRSVALILESPGQQFESRPFGNRVHPVRFIPRGHPYTFDISGEGAVLSKDDCAIIDSWMLLHKPVFAHREPPSDAKLVSYFERVDTNDGSDCYRELKFLPHTFVELSPVIIGGGKKSPDGAFKIFSGLNLNTDARFYLSSPKRYVWDEDRVGERGSTWWKQIPNPTDESTPDFYEDMGGLIRYFMDASSEMKDWDIDNPPKDLDDFRHQFLNEGKPSYPRRDALCWFALSILEMTHRQINSSEYLKFAGRESLPRRLREVRLTYPAGWTHEEQSKFFHQWQRAINLFTLSRFGDHRKVSKIGSREGGMRPVLAQQPMDEAVCSQIPILYSDLQTLKGDAGEWLSLYGDGEAVTIMNVDIGGGTTDIAIIEYQKNQQSSQFDKNSLISKLKFKDGYSLAGDTLVKKIIERILVPVWLNASNAAQMEGIPDARRWIYGFMEKSHEEPYKRIDPKGSFKLARIIRLIFIPIVNRWLQNLSEQADNPDLPWERLSLEGLAQEGQLDTNVLRELNQILIQVIHKLAVSGSNWEGRVFEIDGIQLDANPEQINACVDDVFGDFFDHLGLLAGRFNCDLVIVSGKPSEIPRIRQRITESFPLLPQRIISMKNFAAGDWYPFKNLANQISDAKTCTVVGAALYQDMLNGNLKSLKLISETELNSPKQSYWGIIPNSGSMQSFYDEPIFTPHDLQGDPASSKGLKSEPKTITVSLPSRFGRQVVLMPSVNPDPIYEIRMRPEFGFQADIQIRLTLRSVSYKGEGEKLEVVSIDPDPRNPQFDCAKVEWRLNTLADESFWLDSPKLFIS